MNYLKKDKHKKTFIHIYPSSSFKGGGAVRINLLVAETLIKNGYKVISILPLSPKCNDLKPVLKKMGSICLLLPMPLSTCSFQLFEKGHLTFKMKELCKFSIKAVFSFFSSLLIFFILLIDRDSEIIHGGGNIFTGYGVAKLLSRNIYVHVHEYIGVNKGLKIRYIFKERQKRYFNYAKCVICVSDALAKYVKKIYPNSNVKTVYNCLTSEIYDFQEKRDVLSEEQISILLLSAITEQKGQDQAVMAISKLKRDGINNIHMDLVGPYDEADDYYRTIKKMIKKEHLEEIISIYGREPNPQERFSKADVALTCSELESFGLTTLEAAFCGCIIIGSDTGATKELINNIGGLTYHYRDSGDLANKIETVINKRDYYKRKSLDIVEKAKELYGRQQFENRILEVLL